jgi:DNA processing protein
LNELAALVALSAVPHLGSIKIRLLVQYFGSAIAAMEASASELKGLPGFGPKITEAWGHWNSNKLWMRDLELIERMQVQLISWTSPDYPRRLLEISDHPILLYVKGQLTRKDAQALAVVGTRQPTIYGLEMAEQFGRGLASHGFTVVSGLARGIDTAAHRGALQAGRTLAVIGSGLADIYPSENRALAEQIAQNGALISEFPMLTPPDRQNFPQRNRIVSGMCSGVLLVEAPLKSGAMITMEKALAYNRKTFALPGRADGDHFRGNHCLIKEGLAKLVEKTEDVIESFEDLFQGKEKLFSHKSETLILENEEAELLKKLPVHEVSFNEISMLTSIPVSKLNVLLMSLMLKKAIKEYPGKIYKKVFY